MPEIVQKRKVVMKSAVILDNGEVVTHEAVDYVPVWMLDSYSADAGTRWQSITVGEEQDSGPGGDDLVTGGK